MTSKNKTKRMHTKAQQINWIALSFAPTRMFRKNKRAISPVMSNLILIGAVLAIGMVALAYARSNSINYQSNYSASVNSDIGKLKESLTIEYAHYDANSQKLFVYFLNSGSGNLEVTHESINGVAADSHVYAINDQGQSQPITTVGHGEEAYVYSIVNLQPGEYSIKLTTRSESTYAYQITV